MSSEEKGIKVPSKESIQQWNSLGTNIISESSACAVPNTVFIQYENEKFFNRYLFEKEIPSLTATSNVSQIKVFDDLIKQADMFINRIYSRRSIASAISPFIQAKKGQAIEESLPYFNEVFTLCSDTINFIKSCVSILHNVFDDAPIWQNGYYSDVLLNSICTLFYKITTLDEMKLFKSSLTNDLTTLKGLAKGAQSNDSAVQDLQMNINTAQLFDSGLLEAEKGRSKADKQKISAIFATFISQNLEKSNYLIPETLYMYIRFLMFLCRYTEQDSKTIQLLAQHASKHPLLPLAYEVSITIADYMKSVSGFAKEMQKIPFDPRSLTFQMNSLKNDLEARLSELPSQIANAEQNIIPPEQFLSFIMNIIHLVAALKNVVREQYAYKLTVYPPEQKGEVKSQFLYERSIRKGYNHDELSILLRSLMLWRSTCDQLRDSSEAIMKIISSCISSNFQFFIKNTCERVMQKAKKESESKIQGIIMSLSARVGDWDGEMYPNIKKKKQPPYPNKPRNASPNLASLEFARIQLQHIFNPSSEYMKSGGKKSFKSEKIFDEVASYLDDSFLHTTVLQFGQLISSISDQSDLYFKEVQLNLNKTINFPIKSSLPYVLCEYALQNFKIPELTELIFFPLGIYDDAAHVASTKLNSLFLLDEIRAESQMCLEALTSMISDFVFLSFRTFASVKLLPENIKAYFHLPSENVQPKKEQEKPAPEPEKPQAFLLRRGSSLRKDKDSKAAADAVAAEAAAKAKKKDWAESRAYRLTSLLQQNQFYLHFKLIDVKSMIAKPIENIITQNLNNLMKTTSSNIGTGSLIAIYHGIQIMKETHRLLCEQGVELAHFNLLLNVAFQNAVPNSFSSNFVTNVLKNISEKVTKHCYLMTNPIRLVYPSKAKGLPSYTFGKQNIGKALKSAFDSTTSPITVDHFCYFSHLLENGELAVFIQTFSEEFRTKIMDFITSYEEIAAMDIRRVQDLPLSSSAQTVFDHFVGAYGPSEDEASVKKCFGEMRNLGNMLATAYMLDIAIMNSRLAREEIIGFFKGIGKDGKAANDVTRLFPKILADELKGEDAYLFTYGNDIYPITLTLCLASLMNAIKAFEKVDLFDEKSPTILNFPSLTGFASKWSVLEFIFIYSEADRVEKSESPFQTYGEGVMMLAAALILFMRQERVYHMVNIGRKIQRVKEVDFSANKEDILSKYCVINRYENAAMNWAFQLFQPIIKYIVSSDLIQ